MISVTRLAALNRLLTCIAWGIPFTIRQNSLASEVLNDANVCPGVPTVNTIGMYQLPSYNPATETKDLRLQFIMIGRGGHGHETDEEDEISPITYPHKATDTGMFKPIPFVVAEETVERLWDPAKRNKYCLRRTFNYNNILYVAYFGYRIDTSQVEIQEVLETIHDGKVINSTPYVPTVNDLRPQKTDLQSITDGTYLRTYAGLNIGFNAEEVEEIVQACEILHGNPSKAVVSEIAYCFGKLKNITGVYPVSGNQTPGLPNGTIQEMVAPHIGIIESTYKPVNFIGAFEDTKNIGIAEPLYGVR